MKNSGRRSSTSRQTWYARPIDKREREVRDVLVLPGASVHYASPIIVAQELSLCVSDGSAEFDVEGMSVSPSQWKGAQRATSYGPVAVARAVCAWDILSMDVTGNASQKDKRLGTADADRRVFAAARETPRCSFTGRLRRLRMEDLL
jgi:hypothetical protein